ncbi:lytic polysaccharide monooxygenase [Shewanella sp. JM162201]|uniref:Lytic polysaccharide monooxygenase n=1 Tax=Shewanella jiangmenensis TaxID=2837387 RepID=A0ABS5V5S4_9GAMM|nr:lytic polysaccharide monooxygenase [Shewanella jiangmenensis]MBT1445806.1 lytic polysaccharide monooxygenase [Shewanella jiangmenensis]
MSKHKLILSLALLGASSQALAHGLMEHPKARQQFCAEQGGYWWPADGSAIPNAACRAAFLDSGTVQFVQNHEFSANVADFRNMAAVTSVVSDGKLCAAADHAKRGMDLPSSDWQRTPMTVAPDGTMEVLFAAHTPHNPSFWQFYLSRPDFDAAAEPLSWGKLELIDELGDQPITVIGDKKYYRMQIKVPAGRSGKATLYSRWQRDDVAGEGFYNCADIVLGDGTEPLPTLNSLGSYIPAGLMVSAGDELWFRVFDGDGRERVFERRTLTAAEVTSGAWTKNLAAQVTLASPLVQIGAKCADGSVGYSDALAENQVWTREAGLSYRLDLKSAPPALALTGLEANYRLSGGKALVSFSIEASKAVNAELALLKAGSTVLTESLSLPEGSTARTLTLTAAGEYELSLTPTSAATSSAATASGDAPLRVRFSVSSDDSCSVSSPDAANYPEWQAGKAYNSGDKVSFNSLIWRAKWWTQGSAPSVSNSAWTLVSDVVLPWDTAAPYNQGQRVSFSGHLWQALWWTRGETPGNSGAWQDLGLWQCAAP